MWKKDSPESPRRYEETTDEYVRYLAESFIEELKKKPEEPIYSLDYIRGNLVGRELEIKKEIWGEYARKKQDLAKLVHEEVESYVLGVLRKGR
jgi:hypothetical protein